MFPARYRFGGGHSANSPVAVVESINSGGLSTPVLDDRPHPDVGAAES